jgi:tetratricopeptide (TPR) repeat protein
MHLNDAYDRVEELVSTLTGEALQAALAEEAAVLAAGEEGRAAFLNVLGEFLGYDDKLDEARAAYQEARDDGGPTIIHPLAGLLDVAHRSGDVPAQQAALAELIRLARADELTIATYSNVGEILEEAGDLRQALRWFNIPLRDVDPDDVDDELIAVLNGHWRVRRLLGLPLDRFDEAGEELRAEFRLGGR